jgi:hypothetical protein
MTCRAVTLIVVSVAHMKPPDLRFCVLLNDNDSWVLFYRGAYDCVGEECYATPGRTRPTAFSHPQAQALRMESDTIIFDYAGV